MSVRATNHRGTLDAWLVALGGGSAVDPRLTEAATDVVDTLFDRPSAVLGSIRRFGGQLGSDGWSLERVACWFGELHPHVTRRHRAVLTSFSASTALAAGWADTYVRGAGSHECMDPVTGLGTALVLRLRINEVYRQSLALGIQAGDAFRLVVIDTDLVGLGPFDRHAAMLSTAAICGDVFRGGDTIVRCGHRIVVLTGTSRESELDEALLARRLEAAPIVRSTQPIVWNDRLPTTFADVDRYLCELAG